MTRRPGMLHEIKFDGYRILAKIAGGLGSMTVEPHQSAVTRRAGPMPALDSPSQIDNNVLDKGEVLKLALQDLGSN